GSPGLFASSPSRAGTEPRRRECILLTIDDPEVKVLRGMLEAFQKKMRSWLFGGAGLGARLAGRPESEREERHRRRDRAGDGECRVYAERLDDHAADGDAGAEAREDAGHR